MGLRNLLESSRRRRAGKGQTSEGLRGVPSVGPARRRAPPEGTVHVLGGRRFADTGESTVEHDFLLMGLIREAGLDEVVIQDGEAPEDFARRLLQEGLATGKVLDLLGCLLIPAEISSKDWTPVLGRETSAFVGGLTDPADKARVQALVVSLLTSFFVYGLSSVMRSPTSSAQPQIAS